jgi:hypothetical protein
MMQIRGDGRAAARDLHVKLRESTRHPTVTSAGGVGRERGSRTAGGRHSMIKTTSPRSPEGPSHVLLTPSATHSIVELHVRRLRYFIGLLQTGYRQALRPDPLPRSLRAERIALGIDVPELDAVPLWSTTRTDGAVAIPFVEFIITQIDLTLERIADDSGPAGSLAVDDLILVRGTLRRVLQMASPGLATRALDLPRLGDIFLPRGVIEEVCGPRGLLSVIARESETLLAVGSVGPAH